MHRNQVRCREVNSENGLSGSTSGLLRLEVNKVDVLNHRLRVPSCIRPDLIDWSFKRQRDVWVILSCSHGLDRHMAHLVFADTVRAGVYFVEFVGTVLCKVIGFAVDEGVLEKNNFFCVSLTCHIERDAQSVVN